MWSRPKLDICAIALSSKNTGILPSAILEYRFSRVFSQYFKNLLTFTGNPGVHCYQRAPSADANGEEQSGQ